jgi:phosphopantothenoylcysteine decarboxylase/phosphopantothenate--cysteine ligase
VHVSVVVSGRLFDGMCTVEFNFFERMSGVARKCPRPIPEGVRGDRSRHRVHRSERIFQVTVDLLQVDGIFPRRLALRHCDSTRPKNAPHLFVEGAREQAHSGADGVGGIYDDEVKGAGITFLHKVDAVSNVNFCTWVVEPGGHKGQVLSGSLNNLAVDLTQDSLLHTVVPKDFAKRTAVPPTDNKNPFRIRVNKERNVSDHLMINEFVSFGDHHQAIQGHDAAKARRVENVDSLKGALDAVEHRLYVQAQRDFVVVPLLIPEVEERAFRRGRRGVRRGHGQGPCKKRFRWFKNGRPLSISSRPLQRQGIPMTPTSSVRPSSLSVADSRLGMEAAEASEGNSRRPANAFPETFKEPFDGNVDTAVEMLSQTLRGFRITVCSGGGIAATELPRIARELRRHGAQVRFVVTQAALRFVGETSLEWASANPVVVNPSGLAEHIFDGDAVLVAPATADLIGKAAAGLCTDGVTTLLQSAFGLGKPVFLLPTMHGSMAQSPFVARNLELLATLPRVYVLEPRREEGKLKAPDPKEIALEVCHRWNAQRHFEGRAPRVAVTFGGTRVSIDPVRCITNLSSGRLGALLGEALYRRGCSLLMLKAQTSAELPRMSEAEIVDAAEFSDLHAQLENLNAKATAGIFHIAAVSDFVLEKKVLEKISSDAKDLSLRLVKGPKLLALENVKEVGFQAACKLTTGDKLAGLATARLFASKNNLDLCLWNHADEAFGERETEHAGVLLVKNEVGGTYSEFPLKGKRVLADAMADVYLQHVRTKG